MLQSLWLSISAWLGPLAVLGLSGWVGGVIASRIARKEQDPFNRSLEQLKADFQQRNAVTTLQLDAQNALVTQTLQGIQSNKSELLKHQIDAVKDVWVTWLAFRKEGGKFTTPYEVLPLEELRQPKIWSTVFPWTEEAIDKTLSKLMDYVANLEQQRPLVPQPLYVLTSGAMRLYVRLGLHWQQYKGGKQVQHWYHDSKGKPDFGIQALMGQAKTLGMVLPNPTTVSEFQGMNMWRVIIDDRIASMAAEFFDGGLRSHIALTEEFRKLLAPTTAKSD